MPLMEVIFAWQIDGLYYKPTWSLLLLISQFTVPSIHPLGLFSPLNFGMNGREQFALLRTAMYFSNSIITTSVSIKQSTNAYTRINRGSTRCS